MIKIPEFNPDIEVLHEESMKGKILSGLDKLVKSKTIYCPRQVEYVNEICDFIENEHGLIAKADKLRDFVGFVEEHFFKWQEPLSPLWNGVNGEILNIFGYDDFRGAKWKKKKNWGGAALMQELLCRIRYCPYCNADSVYSVTIERNADKKSVIKSAFDHFFHKDRYPFLSVSLYNLVPSCFRCNSQLKRDAWRRLLDIHHPYMESVDDSAQFIPVSFPVDAWQGKSCNDMKLAFIAKLRCDEIRVKEYDAIFRLSEVYTQLYQQDAFETIQKSKVFNDSYLDYIERMFKSAGVTNVDVHKMVFGVPLERHEIDKHRLAKLILDLRDQFCSEH